MPTRIVIIGGGLTAATAAKELRKLGHDGTIDLITAEPHRPYERPPLSKGYLAGTEGTDKVYVGPDAWEADLSVTTHIGNAAQRIADGHVELADGTSLPYDKVLIATGLTPRELNVPGAEASNVYTFRTIDDADSLRAAYASGGKRVVFVGAGWIGLELAAAARGYENDVTVISPDAIPLSKALGPEMGTLFKEMHEEHGVRFVLEQSVIRIDTDEAGRAIAVNTDAESVPADIVVIGIGATPNTALAESAGVEVDHGILVDERMESSVDSIYAAGDVATAFHPVLGERLRSEHWAFAVASGKVAASSMTGGSTVLNDIPYFYTDQYDLGMEYSGYGPLAAEAEVVIRGDLAKREFIAFWVREGHVVAGMNVNIWNVNEEVQRLIRDRVSVTREQLADPAVKLASIA